MTPPLTKIGVGTAPNEGTGDALRVAFQTTNSAIESVDDIQTTLGVNAGATTLEDDTEVAGASAVGDTVLGRFQKHGGRLAEVEATGGATVNVPEQSGGTYELTAKTGGYVEVDRPEVTLRPPAPPAEGRQSQVLWALSKYDNTPGWVVRPRGIAADAHQPNTLIATACLPRYMFSDPAKIRFSARGEFTSNTCASMIIPGFRFGPTSAPADIQYSGGQMRANGAGAATIAQAGAASWKTLGDNALGWEPGEVMEWRIDATIEVLPTFIDAFEQAGTLNGNVKVTGEMILSPKLDGQGASATNAGPYLLTESDTWYPGRKFDIDPDVGEDFELCPKGYQVAAHGKGYRSIWRQPVIEDVDALTQLTLRQDAYHDRAPGSGRRWRQHWYELQQRVPLNWSQNAVFDDDGLTFSFLMGGAYAMDPGGTYRAWADVADEGHQNYDTVLSATLAPGADNHPVVEHADSLYAARFTHTIDSSIAPGGGVDSESERYWRLLPAVLRDSMTVYSTFASIEGGRVGVSDFLTL